MEPIYGMIYKGRSEIVRPSPHLRLKLVTNNRVIRFRVVERPNASDQIAFCASHSFLVEVQTNAGYIHETHA